MSARNPPDEGLSRSLLGSTTYPEWVEIAREMDRGSGADAWRDDDESPFYDAASIREQILAMRRARERAQPRQAIELLHDALSSSLGEVTAHAHYETALAGPKRIVTSYVEELLATVAWLGDPAHEASSIVDRLRSLEKEFRALGATALMLSGGAGLGFYHLGVLRALLLEGSLPDVLAGSSTGAMIAGWACCYPDDALLAVLNDPSRILIDGVRAADWRVAGRDRAILDRDHLYKSLLGLVGPYTFEEAEHRSGRSLNISVSPTQLHQRPRLLSSVTSPTVLVSSAVLASSAVPVLYPPVALTQRDRDGVEVPYIPRERWIDGSVHGDVPMRSVGRLHNVTTFIVSQVNPHVAPFVRDRGRSSAMSAAVSSMGLALRTQGMAVAGVMNRLVSAPSVVRSTKQLVAMLTQEYSGDIDIVPAIDPAALARLFANPRTEDLRRFIAGGQQATWLRLARIRDQVNLRRAFERSLASLRLAVRTDGTAARRGACETGPKRDAGYTAER